MPAKKKAVKMGLSDFTGGQVADGYIPTTSEELEGDKGRDAQERAERDERRARRETNTAPGSHYGASGAAGAAMDWRGGGKVSQPDVPAEAPTGAAPKGKFGKAGALDWGARGGDGDAAKEGKAFGGTGFGNQPQNPFASMTRDAFGGASPQEASASPPAPGRKGAGYNPVIGAGKKDRAQPEFSRSAFGGAEASSPPQQRSGSGENVWGRARSDERSVPQQGDGTEEEPFQPVRARSPRRDARSDLSRDVFGGGSPAVPEKRPALRSRKPVLVFSREEFETNQKKQEVTEAVDIGETKSSWADRKKAPADLEERVKARLDAEAKAEEEVKQRMADKLAALAEKAEAPAKLPAREIHEKPERREKADRRELKRPARDGKKKGGMDWAAESEPQIVEVTINKAASEPLGVVCQNKTLRVQDVKRGSACWRSGVARYVKSHRLTHVNGEVITEMAQVRYAAGGQERLVLKLDPSLSDFEKGQQEEQAQEQQEEQTHDLAVLRKDKVEASAQDDDGDDDVEPDEDFYANAAQDDKFDDAEDDEEEDLPKFEVGDRVQLTDEGCDDITEDDAWEDIPITKNQAGTVVGWDDDDDCPVVRGPGGQEMGLHPTILRLASPAAVAAADEAERQHEARRSAKKPDDSKAEARRRAEEAAKEATRLAVNSNFNPLAEPFLPKALRAQFETEGSSEELRVDPSTGQAYTQQQFMAKYGRTEIWERSRPAPKNPMYIERRFDPYTNELYTEKEFLARYGRPVYWQNANRYTGARPPMMAR